MKNNLCEKCRLPVLRARRGESPQQWRDLEPVPIRVSARRGRVRKGAFYLDGRTAFWPDDMAARLRGTDETLADFAVHIEHQCGGR